MSIKMHRTIIKAQNGTEWKGQKLHRIAQNVKKSYKMVLKRHRMAQNDAEGHRIYILCRFVCLLLFCTFLLTLI